MACHAYTSWINYLNKNQADFVIFHLDTQQMTLVTSCPYLEVKILLFKFLGLLVLQNKKQNMNMCIMFYTV